MNYVTCNYQGRLGNLMFEIANVMATAWRNNLTPTFSKDCQDYYKDLRAFQEYILPIVRKLHNHANGEINFHQYHEKTDFACDPIVTTKDTELIGYFTSSKYFNDYRKQVIELFRAHDLRDKVFQIRQMFPGFNLVSVHVRRADYVTDYNWALPLSYYERAAKLVSHNSVFVIFSDDHQWCIDNLGFMENKVFIADKDYIELQLMGLMDEHIIANSTFSAMGIILGDPDMNKKIIAPAKWIDGEHNTGIYEPHWTKV